MCFFIFDINKQSNLILRVMSHETAKAQTKIKKKATKTLKEKRAEKKAKKEGKK